MAKFIRSHISQIEDSEEYKQMKIGREYYEGDQDILKKKRLAIGKNGRLQEITNVPNNIYLNNQYAKLVDQKVNYIMTKPPNIEVDDEKYQTELSQYFSMKFVRTMNYVCLDVFNCGIGWLYLYTDGQELKYKILDPLEVYPIWEDKSKESLAAVIRKWNKDLWDSSTSKIEKVQYVTLYTGEGFYNFVEKDGDLVVDSTDTYLKLGDAGYNWSENKIPFIYFRANRSQSTLLKRVKCLQDGINSILSMFGDKVQEDPRNTILILKGYEGENLGEFRQQLAQYGAVKVAADSDAGGRGDVNTLEITVNSENFEVILRILKEALIENGRGIDSRLERMGASPNEMNIESMYADIELDANRMELEVQASFEHMLDFYNEVYNRPELPVTFTFKRNVMVNRESVVDMIVKSRDILPTKVMLDNHPLVEDSVKAMELLTEEKKERMEDFRRQLINNSENFGDEE